MLGKVVLTKVDADAPGTVLPGAVFKLEEQAADGSWVEVPGYESLVTDGSGLIEVERLAMGTYRFVEVSAPEGYELGTVPVEFTLAEDAPGLEVAVTATNVKTPVLGGALLTKVDADDATTVLAGAVFKLEQHLSDGTWAVVDGFDALATNDEGIIEVHDLPVGSYRFVETAAPEGYVLDETPVEFGVEVGQPEQVELTMENAPVPPDPVDPVDPNDPTDPTDPAKPVDPAAPGTPSTSQPSTPNAPGKTFSASSIARTGDAVPLAVLGGLGCDRCARHGAFGCAAARGSSLAVVGVVVGVLLELRQHRDERVEIRLVDALDQAVRRVDGNRLSGCDQLVRLLRHRDRMRAAVGLVLVAHHETLALERVEVAGDGGLLLARAFRQLLLREFARAVQLVDEVPLARRDLVGLERGFQRLGDGALRVVHEESDEAVMLVDHA